MERVEREYEGRRIGERRESEVGKKEMQLITEGGRREKQFVESKRKGGGR